MDFTSPLCTVNSYNVGSLFITVFPTSCDRYTHYTDFSGYPNALGFQPVPKLGSALNRGRSLCLVCNLLSTPNTVRVQGVAVGHFQKTHGAESNRPSVCLQTVRVEIMQSASPQRYAV